MGTLSRTLLVPSKEMEYFSDDKGNIVYRLMVDGGYNVNIH